MKKRSKEGTGREFLLTLLPLLFLLAFALYDPVVGGLIIGSPGPNVEASDIDIARFLFGDYQPEQYRIFLLLTLALAILVGLFGGWVLFRRFLPAIRLRQRIDTRQAGRRFLASLITIGIVAFGLGNLIAVWAGTQALFSYSLGYVSFFALQLWAGGTVGLCGFTTLLGFLALRSWGLQQVVSPAPGQSSLDRD